MSTEAVTKVAVIGAQSTSAADGIRDYSECLVDNLRQRPGIAVELFWRRPGAFGTEVTPAVARNFGSCSAADAVIVQYNPFWHGRRGFAPGLPIALLRLRLASRNTTIALMVHETYVDPKNWKWALMRVWQRSQLRALQCIADIQLCSIEEWTSMLRRSAPDVPARHLPVPSNLPDRREARAASRARLGVDGGGIVLATFGLYHPGRLTDLMLDAARAVRGTGARVRLLNLGIGEASRYELEPGIELISTGFLDAAEAAEALSAADLFMAAFADGVSTRRGTLMAALQHEIAVVGTNGHLTDSILRDASDALRLAPVGQPDTFISAVVDVATSVSTRASLASGGRNLYERKFDWPVLTDALLGALQKTRT